MNKVSRLGIFCIAVAAAGLGGKALAERLSAFVPLPLTLAHTAYAEGDHNALLANVVKILSDDSTDQTVHQNAVELLRADFKAGKGKIPSDMHLPAGLGKLELSQRRVEVGGKVEYAVEILGLAKPENIGSASLMASNGRLIVGTSEDKIGGDGKAFWVKRIYEKPIDDVLFRIAIRMKDGGTIDGWIPVFDWRLDESPRIIAPQPHQNLFTPNPVVAWRPIEANDDTFSDMRFWSEVIHSDAPNWEWDVQWYVGGASAKPTRYTVGVDGKGVRELEKGRYLLNVTYSHSRNIGDITISSGSTARVAFYVR